MQLNNVKPPAAGRMTQNVSQMTMLRHLKVCLRHCWAVKEKYLVSGGRRTSDQSVKHGSADRYRPFLSQNKENQRILASFSTF